MTFFNIDTDRKQSQVIPFCKCKVKRIEFVYKYILALGGKVSKHMGCGKI